MADNEGGRLLRKLIASLSSALSTPIPYFMKLPLEELYEWAEAAKKPKAR
ncbi:hypothetical protein [Paenibacillus sp. 2TAB19]